MSHTHGKSVYFKGDNDNITVADDYQGGKGDNRKFLASSGHPADETDRQAVTALVKRYYAAALAGDGATGCSLLNSSFATSVGSVHLQASGSSTSPQQAGCATVLSSLFRYQHGQLLADGIATMGVLEVRLKGNGGMAVLGFKTQPERQIVFEHEGDSWKLAALFDGEIP